MRKMLRGQKAFVFTEVMIVVALFLFIIGATVSVWLFTYQSWSVEKQRTFLRMDLITALRTIQNDVRLSSSTYMSFYPTTGDYTAISIPVAQTDANGLLTLDADNHIVWDKTVIYHLYAEADGSRTLRRTVFDPRDNSFDFDQRFVQLQAVISGGTGAGAATDTDFAENIESFSIVPLPYIIDFYTDSTDPEKVGKVIFGYIRVEDGDHTIRFEVAGKNDNSTGYGFGLDYISIEPCGSSREAEYYNSSFAPGGMLGSNGRAITRINDSMWSNSNYLEYDAQAAGDYIEFTDHYDLWRDSTFEAASLNNTFIEGDEVHAKIEVFADREIMGKLDLVWNSYVETEDVTSEGHDGGLPDTYPIAIRTIISNSAIDTKDVTTANPSRGHMVRVRFVSSTDNPLKIGAAYITRRSSGDAGLANQSTTGLTVEEYHRHQQLFFKDIHDGDNDSDTDEILAEGWVPENSELWSEWAGFPLVLNDGSTGLYDYFVTICIPDQTTAVFPSGWSAFNPAQGVAKYWQGSSAHSYYVTGDYATVVLPASGTTDWSSYTVNTSNNIYVTADIDICEKEGTVESNIFDTSLADPAYSEVKWSEVSPSGTEVLLKVRSSDNLDMVGATDWSSVAGSTSNPGTLAAGTGRYFQYLAKLSVYPFWTAPSQTLSYAAYVDTQVGLGNDYSFPQSGGDYLVAAVYSTWIDDVEVDWPGEHTGVAALTGYIAKKDDYGQVLITVGGANLRKVLDINLSIAVEYQDRTIRESNSVEVEPLNTGK